MTTSATFIPLRELLPTWDEPGLAPTTGDGLLDRIGIDDFDIVEGTDGATIKLTLGFRDEIGFSIPGVDGLGLYFGSHGSASTLALEFDIKEDFAVRLVDAARILRLPPVLAK